MKNVVDNFVTCTGTIRGELKHVSYNISMETRLHLKSVSYTHLTLPTSDLV